MPGYTKLMTIFTLPPGSAEAGSSIVYIFNGTLWVAFAATLVWLWRWARTKDVSRANLRLQTFLLSTPILIVLTLGAIFNVGSGSYSSYEVPRDILQDIQSAKFFWAGQPVFPLEMRDQIKETLDHEPAPATLGAWFPEVAKAEKESYDKLVHDPWTQAHPATMTLLLATLVPWLGVRHIVLLFCFGSVCALLGTFRILRKELGSGRAEDSRLWLALTLACLGWYPFYMILRNGQITFVLTLLLAASWYFLRHERNIAAGVCIGLATGLKLFPGLLIVYLFFRHRKAFWPAAIAAGSLLATAFAIIGRQNTLDYFKVVHYVETFYMSYRANLSIQSVLLGIASPRLAAILARVIFIVSLGLLAWLATRREQKAYPIRALDLEYSMFMTAVLLLSPLCWDNYLVLLVLPMTVLLFGLREGSVFAQNHMRTVAFVLVAAVAAIPEPFGIWMARLSHPRFTMFFYKTPVIAVAGVLALLWGMRIQLAQPSIALPVPQSDDGMQERPVAA